MAANLGAGQDYYVPMNDDGTSGRFANFALQMGPMIEVMRSLVPTHSAFNGAYGSLTRDIRLEAEVGETILMLHSQANNPSFPHLIGGHGDWVWPNGKFEADFIVGRTVVSERIDVFRGRHLVFALMIPGRWERRA